MRIAADILNGEVFASRGNIPFSGFTTARVSSTAIGIRENSRCV